MRWAEAVERFGEDRLREEARNDTTRSDWRRLGVPADVALPLLLATEEGRPAARVALSPREIYLNSILAHVRRHAGTLALHSLPDAPVIVDQIKGHITVWAKMVRAKLRVQRRGES